MFSPLGSSKFTLIQQDAPKIHRVAAVTGGLNNIYRQIKYNITPHPALESRYGRYSRDNVFSPQPGMPLLASRYRFLSILGRGQSSLFIKVEDLFQAGVIRAVKVLHTNYRSLGVQECDCIRRLNLADPYCTAPTLRLCNVFMFHGHYCMVFEILAPEPLTYYFKDLHQNVLVPTIRRVTLHLLQALGFLQNQNIIHADLKPANILLEKECDFSTLKVVDFGNSIRCVKEEISLYFSDFELQTLLYRAPEVVYGLPFGLEVDMWSLGCIIGELLINRPLFQGRNKTEVLEDMTDLLGPLPEEIFRRGKFFTDLQHFTNRSAYKYAATTPELMAKLECRDYAFVDFLRLLLQYNPHDRMTVAEAARHPFLAKEIPILPNELGEPTPQCLLIDHLNYTKRPFIEDRVKQHCHGSLELLHMGTTAEYRLNKNKACGSLGEPYKIQEKSRNCRFPTPEIVVLEKRQSPVHAVSNQQEISQTSGGEAPRQRERHVKANKLRSPSGSEPGSKVRKTSQASRKISRSIDFTKGAVVEVNQCYTSVEKRDAKRKHVEGSVPQSLHEGTESKPAVVGSSRTVFKTEDQFSIVNKAEQLSDQESSNGFGNSCPPVKKDSTHRARLEKIIRDARRSTAITAGRNTEISLPGKERYSIDTAGINTTYQVKEEQPSSSSGDEGDCNPGGPGPNVPRWREDPPPIQRSVKGAKTKPAHKSNSPRLAKVEPFVVGPSKSADGGAWDQSPSHRQGPLRRRVRPKKQTVPDQNSNTIAEDKNLSATRARHAQESRVPVHDRHEGLKEEESEEEDGDDEFPHSFIDKVRESPRQTTNTSQHRETINSGNNQQHLFDPSNSDRSSSQSERSDESDESTSEFITYKSGVRRTETATRRSSKTFSQQDRLSSRNHSNDQVTNTYPQKHKVPSAEQNSARMYTNIQQQNRMTSTQQVRMRTGSPPFHSRQEPQVKKRKRREEETSLKKKKCEETSRVQKVAQSPRGTRTGPPVTPLDVSPWERAPETRDTHGRQERRRPVMTSSHEQSDTSYSTDDESSSSTHDPNEPPSISHHSKHRETNKQLQCPRYCKSPPQDASEDDERSTVRTPHKKSGREKIQRTPGKTRSPVKSGKQKRTPRSKGGRSKPQVKHDSSPGPYDEVMLL